MYIFLFVLYMLQSFFFAFILTASLSWTALDDVRAAFQLSAHLQKRR